MQLLCGKRHMRRIAIPWFTDITCCGRHINIDMHIEFYGTGKLPREYEKALEKFFKTKNKQKMQSIAIRSDVVPVWCSSCKKVQVVDVKTGEPVMDRKMIASELIKVAKLLIGMSLWDMKIVPPTQQDIDSAVDKARDALNSKGFDAKKIEFQRFLSYTNPDRGTHGSNKFLSLFGFSDKDGKFSGAVIGGRIGENNASKQKVYQNWGVVDERTLKNNIDGYIRKKTNQRDAYTEVKGLKAR